MIINRRLRPSNLDGASGLNPEPNNITLETDQQVAHALRPTLSPRKWPSKTKNRTDDQDAVSIHNKQAIRKSTRAIDEN
jgi:hypothetical protein|tara:strand:- start:129 stop:365 length:237 start_codon:yes stop_codon:yes gene_type:complete